MVDVDKVDKMRFIALLGCLAGAVLMNACTVIESRDTCPVYLKIYSDDVASSRADALLYVKDGSGQLFRGWVPIAELENGLDFYEWTKSHDESGKAVAGSGITARKGLITVSVISGVKRKEGDDYDVPSVIRYRNCQADSLYAFSRQFSLEEEEFVIRDAMRKNFSTVTMTVSGSRPGYSLALASRWTGIEVESLQPREREDSYSLSELMKEDGVYEYRISRQGIDETKGDMDSVNDDDLVLLAYIDSEDEGMTVAKLSQTISITRLLKEKGYDFFRALDEDMEDVSINADLTQGIITISVGDFEVVSMGVVII